MWTLQTIRAASVVGMIVLGLYVTDTFSFPNPNIVIEDLTPAEYAIMDFDKMEHSDKYKGRYFYIGTQHDKVYHFVGRVKKIPRVPALCMLLADTIKKVQIIHGDSVTEVAIGIVSEFRGDSGEVLMDSVLSLDFNTGSLHFGVVGYNRELASFGNGIIREVLNFRTFEYDMLKDYKVQCETALRSFVTLKTGISI